jgi:O-acetyl-ADP-ribose deacetylase (regulator of RNase III)/tRNA A-37 threonylcarbamoyl transferase component Bud32
MDTTILDQYAHTHQSLSPDAVREVSTRYEILQEVGRGGMGIVYRARHRTLDRLVALKVMLPGASPERFLREARLLAQIHSPNVVGVHDCEVLPDGHPVLALEWVEGTTLQSVLEQSAGPISEEVAVGWMRQTVAGMLAAGEMHIIHRDLKPANILLSADRAGRLPGVEALSAKVADFGLARGPEGQMDLTLPGGGMMGTPFYMAPEQAEDPRGVDTRADIYSFGATFYHALTGVTPFVGETVFSVLFRHKTEPLIPPRTRNPHLSPRVNELLERCLAKSPNDRFASFQEVRKHLDPSDGMLSPWFDENDARMTGYLERYQARRETYLYRRSEMATPDVYDFPGGGRLIVLAGDMVEQHVDALVSSEDGHLTMGETVPEPRGVASALRRAAGPEYVAEARRFVPVRPGRVLVTGAGQLPARFVFHGITLEGQVEQRICPSRDLIAEILGACFYHADTLHVASIALPLLGTGTGGFSQEVCLDTMFRHLCRALLHSLTTVREARLVLFWRQGSGGTGAAASTA